MVSPDSVLLRCVVDLKCKLAPLSTNFVAMAFSSQDRRTAVSDIVGSWEPKSPIHSFGIVFESGCVINPGSSPINPASARFEIRCNSASGCLSNMALAQTNCDSSIPIIAILNRPHLRYFSGHLDLLKE